MELRKRGDGILVGEIGEVEEYKYLGVTVKAGLNGGFKYGDRMVDANGVLGMVKYAAAWK